MVRAIACAAALSFLSTGRVSAQLDLTPTESFYEVEGIRVPNVSFRNGPKNVAYSPPGDWTLSGGGRKLALSPPEAVQAGATIETEPAPMALPPASPENIKAYRDLAVSLVPREGSKVEILEAIICPMQISGKPMIEVTLSYTFFGQPFRMNVLFMPREKEQLRFRLVARATDYPPLFKAFRSSLFTMQGL